MLFLFKIDTESHLTTEGLAKPFLLLMALLMMLLGGCMSSPSKTPKLLYQEHVLVGQIQDVNQQAFIDQAALIKRILDSEFLLLGERHDNPVHHQHQAWVINQLENAGIQASVAFEMIDPEQGERLAKVQLTSVDQLITELNHSNTGWDYENRYKSLFSAVLDAGFNIDAANLNRKQLMDNVMQGEDKLPADYKLMLNKTPLSAGQLDALQEEISQSHCGMLDDKTSSKMVLGQRLRDAIMADSMLNSQQPLKVLIAGAGHVRNDRAVPFYLRSNLQSEAKAANILSIGMIEVQTDEIDPTAYAEPWGSGTLPFDLVWFTPQVKREDMCKQLKAHFKKKSE